nr:immunoglobulin heavy chain junction region [Mus musculus]
CARDYGSSTMGWYFDVW